MSTSERVTEAVTEHPICEPGDIFGANVEVLCLHVDTNNILLQVLDVADFWEKNFPIDSHILLMKERGVWNIKTPKGAPWFILGRRSNGEPYFEHYR
jgi:hypothetical protein